jgi:cytochrome c oxidase subunit 4
MARHRHQTRSAILVGIGLLALLGLTVLLGHLLTGVAATVTGLLIAVAKAGLVVLFFMELVRETNQIRIFAAASLLWIGIIFTLTLSDYLARRPEARAPYPPKPPAVSSLPPLAQQ